MLFFLFFLLVFAGHAHVICLSPKPAVVKGFIMHSIEVRYFNTKVEDLGYIITFPYKYKKDLVINTQLLGFWLNNGAILSKSLQGELAGLGLLNFTGFDKGDFSI